MRGKQRGLWLLIAVTLWISPIRVMAETAGEGEHVENPGGSGEVAGEGSSGQVILKGTVGQGDCSLSVLVLNNAGGPMQNAKVAVQMQENFATTGKDGRVLVNQLVEGVEYEIMISHGGFYDKSLVYVYNLEPILQQDGRYLYPQDELVIQLDWIPVEDPVIVPQGTTAGQKPGITTAGNPVLKLEIPTGSDRYLIPEPMIQQSMETGLDLEIQYRDETGTLKTLVLPAFSRHDVELLQGNELWLEELNGIPYFHIEIAELTALDWQGMIPHNLAELAVSEQLNIRMSFLKDNQELEDSLILPTAILNWAAKGSHFDLGARIEKGSERAMLIIQKTGDHEEAKLPVPIRLFAFAQSEDRALIVEQFNPKDKTDLWYRWDFTRKALKEVALKENEFNRTVDLSISDEPEEANLILSQTDRNQSQYLIIAHDGALPVPADLKVKNRKNFKEPVDFVYSDPDARSLDVILMGLEPNKEGFYDLGLMRHCSSYALTQAGIPAHRSAENQGFWVILAGLVILACAGLAWWIKTRRESAE
ncbi:hypothetical protein [Holdemania massiliensis]|uniref:hypothetical protein n=1 Tax=Holdemania massiliensis TaxID=1468449 RepID=UPI001F055179|nr:hypothetical protein [Holdemania massiliensis]MCH1942155.1 hypothetical protein [Holdemania massiliensis]